MDPNLQPPPTIHDELAGLNDDTSSFEAESVESKLFIGGLSWQTTADGLRAYFSNFGEIQDVNLMIDKRSNQPRGFAFVTFKDPEC